MDKWSFVLFGNQRISPVTLVITLAVIVGIAGVSTLVVGWCCSIIEIRDSSLIRIPTAIRKIDGHTWELHQHSTVGHDTFIMAVRGMLSFRDRSALWNSFTDEERSRLNEQLVAWQHELGLPTWACQGVDFEGSWPFWKKDAFGWPYRCVSRTREYSQQNKTLPFHPIWLGFFANTVTYSVILAFFVLIWQRCLQILRLRRSRCPVCSYILNARVLSGCPECGWGRPADASAE